MDRSEPIRAPRVALVVPTVAMSAFTAAMVADSSALGGTAPLPAEDQVTAVVRGMSFVALIVAGGVHWGRWRLGRDRAELSLVFAGWQAMSAILSLAFGQLWRLSWWDYHLYLLAGFAATSWAVVAQYRRSRSLAGIVAGVAERDPLEQVARGHPEALDALIGAVEPATATRTVIPLVWQSSRRGSVSGWDLSRSPFARCTRGPRCTTSARSACRPGPEQARRADRRGVALDRTPSRGRGGAGQQGPIAA